LSGNSQQGSLYDVKHSLLKHLVLLIQYSYVHVSMCLTQIVTLYCNQVEICRWFKNLLGRDFYLTYFIFHSNFTQVFQRVTKRYKDRFGLKDNVRFVNMSPCFFCMFSFLFNFPKGNSYTIIVLKYVYFVWVKVTCLKRVVGSF
jgi:hypothetical protein